MVVYPPRMAPFGLKLWENAFQMIPDISFFDAGGKKIDKIFDKNFRLKNSPKNCFRKLPVLEERRYFGPHQQIRLEK